MSTLERYILTLPKDIQSIINFRCQALGPVVTASIFEPNICLESFDSTQSRYIFSIYFKHKIVQVENGATQILHQQKTLVEQIELLIEEDETKPKIDEKDGSEKVKSYKSSVEDRIMNSPFFTHIRKRNSPDIGPTHFEANCSQDEESTVRSSLEAVWLPAINIGQYTIKVGLFSLPSQEIQNLVDDYISMYTSHMIKTQKLGSSPTKQQKKEGKSPSLDDSWEVLEDEEEVKINEEKREPEPAAKNEQSQLPVQQEEKKISEDEIQKNEIEKEKEKELNPKSQLENENGEKKESLVNAPEDPEKKKIREGNKAKFVDRLYEYTEQLKRMSDKKFKRREDSCQNLLNKENNFLYALTGNNAL